MHGNFSAVTKITAENTKKSSQSRTLKPKAIDNSLTAGGYPFALDPNLSANATLVSWTPAFDPFKLLLVSSPIASPTADAVPDAMPPIDQDGSVRISLADHSFDALVGETLGHSTLAAVVVFDDHTLDRLVALSRFWTALRGLNTPPDDRVTPRRRARIRTMLQAIDGHIGGATYRAIGEVLFPRHHIDAASWVGNPVRETTIRLVRDGMKLVRGGYRDLLRRTHRP